MDILIRIGQLLLSLMLLVTLHELGHFTAARIFKTRVEKFVLFFNPWFSIFKFKKGETEYGLGWLPLGGYVKISGMIDESMDKKQMRKPPQPYEFRSKKTWQRLIIILAGVFVNLALGCLIYMGTIYTWGESYLPNANVKHGIVVDSIGREAGLKNGDKILSVDNNTIENFSDIFPTILIDDSRKMTVLRGNDTITLTNLAHFRKRVLETSSKNFNVGSPIRLRMLFAPFVAAKVQPKSAAEKAGVEKGDEIIAINDTRFKYYDEFQDFINSHTNQDITANILRNGEEKSIVISLEQTPLLGVLIDGSNREPLDLAAKNYTLKEAIPAGFKKAFSILGRYVTSLKLLFTKEGASSVGGMISMANIFPKVWDWQSFWEITAFLSIMFAFLNVLPIPGLDGGHAIFIIYEMITGRKPGVRFMEVVQTIGILLLISLFIFANANDLLKL